MNVWKSYIWLVTKMMNSKIINNRKVKGKVVHKRLFQELFNSSLEKVRLISHTEAANLKETY